MLGSVVNCIFPSFPRRRESRIRTNSVVFGPKFIRIPTLAGMTADLTTPPRERSPKMCHSQLHKGRGLGVKRTLL